MPITIDGSGTITGASTLATTVASPTFTTPNINLAQFATVSGTAPLYACRAWVNFNGTGTVAIRASGNVTSITDNGTGDYTVNFTTAMPDANYSVVGIAHNPGVGPGFVQGPASAAGNQSAGSFRFNTINNTFGVSDQAFVQLAIFR